MSSDGSSHGSHNGEEPKKPSPSNSPRNSSRGRSITEIIRANNNLSPAPVGTSAVQHREGVGISAPALPGIPQGQKFSVAPTPLNQSNHAPFGLSKLRNNNLQQMGQGMPNLFPTFPSQQNNQLPTLQTYMNQIQLLFMQQQQL